MGKCTRSYLSVNCVCVGALVCMILGLCSIPPCNGGLISTYLRMKNAQRYIQRINEITDGNLNQNIRGDETEITYENGKETSSYQDCGSEAKIEKLSLGSCGGINSDICEIKRGSIATFNLSFVPNINATQLKAVIHGIIDFVPIPFPCPEPDACENSGISCPVIAGKRYDYSLSAPVKDSYPKMKLWIKGQLEDENGTNVICVKMHVHVV